MGRAPAGRAFSDALNVRVVLRHKAVKSPESTTQQPLIQPVAATGRLYSAPAPPIGCVPKRLEGLRL